MAVSINDFFQKVSTAFSQSALNSLSLGRDVVNRSMAKESKEIIARAIDMDSMGIFSKETSENLSKVIKDKNTSVDSLVNYASDTINTVKQVTDNANIDAAYSEAINNFYNKAEKMKKYSSSNRTMSDIEEYLGRKEGSGIGNLKKINGYFLDRTYGSTRTATTLGAYALASVGSRYLLFDGNLTTNSNGERDIAGIPFF